MRNTPNVPEWSPTPSRVIERFNVCWYIPGQGTSLPFFETRFFAFVDVAKVLESIARDTMSRRRNVFLSLSLDRRWRVYQDTSKGNDWMIVFRFHRETILRSKRKRFPFWNLSIRNHVDSSKKKRKEKGGTGGRKRKGPGVLRMPPFGGPSERVSLR